MSITGTQSSSCGGLTFGAYLEKKPDKSHITTTKRSFHKLLKHTGEEQHNQEDEKAKASAQAEVEEAKKLMKNYQTVLVKEILYGTSNALTELENVKEIWGRKYPYAISNWENNWEDVSSFFQFPDDIRRIMYTTNIIEGLNRQYRKVTKTKSVFPSDASLEKMLYLASQNVTEKWTQRYRNWDQVLNQLIVLYGERLTEYL